MKFISYDNDSSIYTFEIVSSSVGINTNFSNLSNTNYVFYVSGNTYVKDVVEYQNEQIKMKTIQAGSDNLYGVKHVQFDYDSGFDISQPTDNAVLLTFQDHFTTVNIKSQNSDGTYSDTGVSITPISFDSLLMSGVGIGFDIYDLSLIHISEPTRQERS